MATAYYRIYSSLQVMPKILLIPITVILLLTAGLMPWKGLVARFKAIHIEAMGVGQRTVWMTEAYKQAKVLPLTGYGPDGLRYHLSHSKDNREYPVRSHYGPLDIVLQFGWVGYLLTLAIVAAVIHTRSPVAIGVMTGWVTFSLLNPLGTPAIALGLLVVLGARKNL